MNKPTQGKSTVNIGGRTLLFLFLFMVIGCEWAPVKEAYPDLDIHLARYGARVIRDSDGYAIHIYCDPVDEGRMTDDGLAYVEGLKRLKRLRLHNAPVTDTGLEHLKGLKSLELLDLSNTLITDAGLVNLKSLRGLEELRLYKTDITDSDLVHLKGLTSLEMLDLSDTSITDAGVSVLEKALPGCEISR